MRNQKGCMHGDPLALDFGSDTDTFISGYTDQDLSIVQGCPVEYVHKYGYLWDLVISIDNSKSGFLPSMPVLQAFAYDAFILDRNVSQERNRG